MRRPLRFAIVGTGGIASAYESAFAGMPEAQVVAVCDVRMDAAANFAARLGCAAYSSAEALASRRDVDAAIICTPPVTHEPIACILLQSGKHVLCEKPLAISVPSAWRMLETARSAGVIMTMASKFRYVEDVRKARAFVQQGDLGDTIFVENTFTSNIDMRSRWNANPAISGGGVLIDNGTHAVDVLRYFLGHLRDVQIIECRRLQGLPVEDTVRVFVQNDEGAMGTSDLSWSLDKEYTTYLRIYGTRGTILVGWKSSKIRLNNGHDWIDFGTGYDKVAAFRAQLRNFCEAITGTAELLITPRDALASVEVIAAGYAALERTQWEHVDTRVEEIA